MDQSPSGRHPHQDAWDAGFLHVRLDPTVQLGRFGRGWLPELGLKANTKGRDRSNPQ